MLRVLAGGAGALLATLIAHYVDVLVGDAVAAVAGFALFYLLAPRFAPGRAPPAPAASPPERFALADRGASTTGPLVWLAGVLALYFGDRGLYLLGAHGLLRKLAAVLLGTAVVALGVALTRRRTAPGP